MDALPYVRRGYAAYVIAVLFLAYMFAYLDRQVIGAALRRSGGRRLAAGDCRRQPHEPGRCQDTADPG